MTMQSLRITAFLALLLAACGGRPLPSHDDAGTRPKGTAPPPRVDSTIASWPDATIDAGLPIEPDTTGLEIHYDFEAYDAETRLVPNLAQAGYDLRLTSEQAWIEEGELWIDNVGKIYRSGARATLDSALRGRFVEGATLELRVMRQSSGEEAPLTFGFGAFHLADDQLGCSISLQSPDSPDTMTVLYAGIPADRVGSTTDRWLDLACVYDGYALRFFVDGVFYEQPLTETAPGKWLMNPRPPQVEGQTIRSIGPVYDLVLGRAETFRGVIDDVRIWSLARDLDD